MMMRRCGLIVVLAAGLAGQAEARTCTARDPIDVEFSKSSAVFLGRVIAKRVTLRDEHGAAKETLTTLNVIKSWKGAAVASLEVFTCGGEFVACDPGFEFLIGQDFVVFATGQPLRVSGCDRTSVAKQAQPTMRWLERRAAKQLPNLRLQPAAVERRGIMRGSNRRG